MTTIHISYGFIDLEAEIEDTEKDCYHPILGHYTVPDNVQIVAIYHKGVDIMDILSESVLDDVMAAYEKHCHDMEQP